MALLFCVCSGAWAEDATYVPQGLKTISAYTVVYCTDITSAGTPATDWVVVPGYGTSSVKYTQITSATDNGNPQGLIDALPTTSDNVNMIQIKTDGNTFSKDKRVVHMHVKGTTGVIAHGNTSSSSRGLAISCTEYVSGETTTMDETTHHYAFNRGSNSGSLICQVTGLDASKEYIVSIYASGGDTRFYAAEFLAPAATEAYTVKFNAGEHGTYTGGDIEEESAGAGIILPALTTKEDGWAFNGWYTAATDGTKAGDAGDTYNPTEDVTLYAQYSEEVAPTISIDNYAPSTSKGSAITLTATPTGSPTPTVTWYQSATATNTGGMEKATGLTYKPDVTAEGTFYYYAVASNGVSPDATSNLITLTVTDPNKYATNNAYYMSVGETPVPDEQIIGDDITMTFVNGKSGESFTAGVADNMVSGVNKNYVASISGSSNNNGWKARFAPTTDGVLSVGVVINKNKTFSISNVSKFRYQGKNGAGDNVDEIVESGSLTTANNDNAKLYVVVTIAVENGKTYDFSVAGSKMGFYGFEFHKAETKNLNAAGYSTFSSNYDVEVSGAKAYTAKLDLSTNTITCTEIADSKVPAGAGVLIFKEANAEVTFTPTYGVAALANNDLKGSTKADGSLATEETGHTYYVLNGDTFKKYIATTFVAGKAYFDVEGGAVQGKLTIIFDDDETTNISNLNANGNLNSNATRYNLAGQKVTESYKGIVIVNGKKYMNK